MHRVYDFRCTSYEDGIGETTVSTSLTTENDSWSGFDGPVYEFFNFLKGCGFVFDIHSELGVRTLHSEQLAEDSFMSSVPLDELKFESYKDE